MVKNDNSIKKLLGNICSHTHENRKTIGKVVFLATHVGIQYDFSTEDFIEFCAPQVARLNPGSMPGELANEVAASFKRYALFVLAMTKKKERPQ